MQKDNGFIPTNVLLIAVYEQFALTSWKATKQKPVPLFLMIVAAKKQAKNKNNLIICQSLTIALDPRSWEKRAMTEQKNQAAYHILTKWPKRLNTTREIELWKSQGLPSSSALS